LDANEPLVVRSARFTTGLPYFHARIETSEDAAGIAYRSERSDRRAAAGSFRARYTATGDAFRANAGSIESFLHERYVFHNERGGRLRSANVFHEPWPLQPARIDIAENTLGALVDRTLSATPELCFFARGIRVRAGATR
jgi:uncharacterized protein YqjF (DUF2071 family)